MAKDNTTESHRTDDLLQFINDIDRFLEVSYVYRGRIDKAKKADNEASYDRHQRLTEILINSTDRDFRKEAATVISEGDARGRTVVTIAPTMQQTKYYQRLVKDRLSRDVYAAAQFPNKKKKMIMELLDKSPEEFLGQFDSSSFAWDILTELASLTFLPSPEELTARDYIHMHTVELKQHLYRIAARAKILSQETSLDLKGRFTLSELYEFQEEKKLVERIVEEAVHGEIRDLVDELLNTVNTKFEKSHYSDSPDKKAQFAIITTTIEELREEIITLIEQEERGYPEILEASWLDIVQAEKRCEDMVIFGLAIAYIVWFTFAIDEDDELCKGMLVKHAIFCTRSLLDEKRWRICKEVGDVLRNIAYLVNNTSWDEEQRNGCNMFEANWMFARKKCGDDISEKLSGWKVDAAHERYKFLRAILSEDYSVATTLVRDLLTIKESSGLVDFAAEELWSWPILEDYRNSSDAEEILKSFPKRK